MDFELCIKNDEKNCWKKDITCLTFHKKMITRIEAGYHRFLFSWQWIVD